ncbi:doublecortin domain-containing protein 2-like isoform X3 [Haliotis asinina]|uniref:doublecortin domain-containing protein 2-like isoform X3 n=1 Tax=Haliotis asinina TaxID=109174 RepID=UPI0035320857
MESDQEISNSASASTDIVLNSIENKGMERAIWIKCFLNGNPHFPGERVLFSQRKFKTDDAFLDEITRKLHSEKSVRALSTPKRGTRIHSLFDLEDGQQYVALTNDAFKKLSYTEIETTPRTRKAHVNGFEIPKKNNKFRDVQGKIPKNPMPAVNIRVWPNKHVLNRPRVVTLGHKELGDMNKVIDCVNNVKSIKDDLGGCAVRLFTRGGTHINDPSLLRQHECYVAVREHERFCGGQYTETTARNFRTSPKVEKLPPLKVSRGSKNGKQWSPDHSHSSYPPSENSYSHRYKKHQNNRQNREEDNGFPRKPVTHKRPAEKKKVQEVDYDKDDGGVFKAKQTNRQTYGAREVRDTRDTRVDLPIDQIPAEEVKEERVRGKPNSYSNYNNNNQTPPKHTSKDYSNMNGYDDDDDRISSPQRNGSPPRYGTPRHTPASRKRSQDRFSLVQSPVQSPIAGNQEEEEAALKIQSHFRGHQVRKQMNKDEDYKDPGTHEDWDTHKKLESRGDDDILLQREREEAATMIQAHYRGYQTRKNQMEKRVDSVMSAGRKSVASQLSQRQDSDLGRKEAAATTIQARYRGYRDRKMLKETR